LKEGEPLLTPQDSGSINETIHKVTVLTPHSFKIGATHRFTPYKMNGIARQLKTKQVINFKSFKESMIESKVDGIPLDGNLAVADFEKMAHNSLAHLAFEALDMYRLKHQGSLPKAWVRKDCLNFLAIARDIASTERYIGAFSKPVEEWSTLTDGAPSLEHHYLSLFGLTV
jgi:Ubiquitin-activating enzyme E1 four-helix bundle/Ubiquitin-activating enzyme E1 FCCH domain